MRQDYNKIIDKFTFQHGRTVEVSVYSSHYDPATVHITDSFFGDTCFDVEELSKVLGALLIAIEDARTIPVIIDENEEEDFIAIQTAPQFPVLFNGGYISSPSTKQENAD